MIKVQLSSRAINEKKYIIAVIFDEFLGIPFEFVIDDQTDEIIISLDNGRKLHFCAKWWNTIHDNLFNNESLPSVIYTTNQFAVEEKTPILFGSADIEVRDDAIYCLNDVFAACFFMLSRLEEAIVVTRDRHERFPATASVAYKNEFLERPIVDEYVEILWNMLIHLDCSIERKVRTPENFITCDVDWPFDPIRRSFSLTLKSFLSTLVRKRNVSSAVGKLILYYKHLFNIEQLDEHRSAVSWIMSENEKVGNKVAFYFIPKNTSPFDSSFDFDSKEIRVLMREIAKKGHEIGLHPGYECFDDVSNFSEASNTLKRVLKEEGIQQPLIGGRMHFLRWDILKTPHLWEAHGYNYDSTLSFADHPGFRCGTSHEFTMYDLVNRKPFKLKQRPLINMESTIIDAHYENMGYTQESIKRFNYFKQKAVEFKGTYTLLWHNTHLEKDEDKQFYKDLIS